MRVLPELEEGNEVLGREGLSIPDVDRVIYEGKILLTRV
jgi:hypothetical protein